VDVGVDREGWKAKGLRHQHRGGLVANAGQGFELLEGARDLAGVTFEQEARHRFQVLRFGRGEADLANQVLDGFDLHVGHRGWCRGAREQGGGDFVDLLVGGLGREQDGAEKGKRVGVVERDLRLGEELI